MLRSWISAIVRVLRYWYIFTMPAPKNLKSQVFGRLTAIKNVKIDKHHNRLWLCQCSCGKQTIVRAGSLASGVTQSCGCLNRERVSLVTKNRNFKHGQAHRRRKTRTYRIWMNLNCRPRYEAGKRCKRWQSFEVFLADMGECPSPKHTIDRIDNARGYEPKNCRWATMKQQQNNRTNNVLLKLNGRTQTLQQWAEETGIARTTLRARIKYLGWSVERAITTPVQRR